MAWFAVYELATGALVSLGTASNPARAVTLGEKTYASEPIAAHWDAAIADFRPRRDLELTLWDGLGTTPKAAVYTLRSGEAVTVAKTLVLKGRIVAGGLTDTTVNAAQRLVRVPQPQGGRAIWRVRVVAGILQVENPDGTFTPDIALTSGHSGVIDFDDALFGPPIRLVPPVPTAVFLQTRT